MVGEARVGTRCRGAGVFRGGQTDDDQPRKPIASRGGYRRFPLPSPTTPEWTDSSKKEDNSLHPNLTEILPLKGTDTSSEAPEPVRHLNRDPTRLRRGGPWTFEDPPRPEGDSLPKQGDPTFRRGGR